MSISGVKGALDTLAGFCQYDGIIQEITAGGAGFAERLKSIGEAKDLSRVEVYRKYLEQKYGNVSIQSVGKDQESLDRIGKSMSGNDVVIAPNILEQMAKDPEEAVYYEEKIDDFFSAAPGLKASFAARGLDYQACGVVIHEDGSVTYISGCADSPERVAEVNAINQAKQEKEAAQQRADLERSREAAAEQKLQMELAYRKRSMMGILRQQQICPDL